MPTSWDQWWESHRRWTLRTKTEESAYELAKAAFSASHGDNVEETRFGFMEKNKLETVQFSCLACKAIFHYVNDTDDTLRPKYCPECGKPGR